MRNHVPFVTRLAALTGALTLTLLALFVPHPARAFCPEVVDINCFWTGGGHCLTSGCRSQMSFCTGSKTGTVTCHTSTPYLCCQPG